MRVLILFVSFLLASVVQAMDTCRNGAFPSYSEFGLAKIVAKPGERVHLRYDYDNCPDDQMCMQEAYLINGNDVIVAHPQEGWACIWYFGKTREFVGWVPQSNIETVDSPKAPRLKDWIGDWKTFGTSTLKIRLAADMT